VAEISNYKLKSKTSTVKVKILVSRTNC